MSGESESIYILLAASDLAAAKSLGEYRAASLADEGFIHASPWNQLNRVANKYYGHAVELRVIEIDPARVRAEIRWEPASGSLYPHIYGPLNMDAVVRTGVVHREPGGAWNIDAQ